MKRGEGAVQKNISALVRKKARTVKELVRLTGANAQYIRKTLRGLVAAGAITKNGVASSQGGCTYKRVRG